MRGVIQLFGSHPEGESTRTIVQKHCPGVEMTNGEKVKIVTITKNLFLRRILFTMERVSNTQALHEASKSQFQYIIACLASAIFNWCGGLLLDMKRKLTKGKHGHLKKFGFKLMLVTFFSE